MKVWDIDTKYLCQQHLSQQHQDIHAIYAVIIKTGDSVSTVPELNRWRGHLWSLVKKHDATADMMGDEPHDLPVIIDCPSYPMMYQTIPEQLKALSDVGCDCEVYRVAWRK